MSSLFGMPLSTVVIVLGVPLVIIIGLVWWGISYSAPEKTNAEE